MITAKNAQIATDTIAKIDAGFDSFLIYGMPFDFNAMAHSYFDPFIIC
jgi:hypothetical protein